MGVIGSIAFLIGALITAIGLLLLIPRKTRVLGKKISKIFIVVCILGFVLSKLSGSSYPNNQPGTITKAQYKQIKEGMTKDEIKDILGEPHTDNKDINEWEYIGIDGKTKNAIVTFEFDPDDKLDLKLDGGLLHSNDDTKKSSTTVSNTITKDQYQKIKIGMSNNEVEKILGKVDKDSEFDLGSKYEWEYSTKGVGLAYIDFDKKTNKVVEKSEIGVLSDGSTTVTDKNGTRNDDSIKNTSDDSDETANDDYANYIEMDINDAIGDKVDWNGKKKNTVREVEVNDNMGKQDGSKLILVRLNAPVEMTNKFTKEKVNEQTLEIAKAIKNDPTIDFKIESITYFWYLPLTDQYGNTKADTAYKISLEKGTLDKINFKHLENVDLPAIADQYNVLYNE